MERVYVGNLPPDICIKDIDDFFRPFGKLVSIELNNRSNPAFAYLQFDNERNAINAVHARCGYNYEGYTLQVKLGENTNDRKFEVRNQRRQVTPPPPPPKLNDFNNQGNNNFGNNDIRNKNIEGFGNNDYGNNSFGNNFVPDNVNNHVNSNFMNSNSSSLFQSSMSPQNIQYPNNMSRQNNMIEYPTNNRWNANINVGGSGFDQSGGSFNQSGGGFGGNMSGFGGNMSGFGGNAVNFDRSGGGFDNSGGGFDRRGRGSDRRCGGFDRRGGGFNRSSVVGSLNRNDGNFNRSNGGYNRGINLQIRSSESFSSEDDLLASSQEAAVTLSGNGGTRHSTPEPQQTQKNRPSTSQLSQNVKIGDKAKRKRKHKTIGDLRRAQYTKAQFILGKIAKNVLNGTVNERDAEDRVKYQAVVDEYLKFKNSAPNTSNAGNGAKRNRSQAEGDKSPKREKVTEKKTNPMPVSTSRRPFNEVVKGHLLVALANMNGELPSPVVTEWSAIESRLVELVMEHMLANKDGPAPRFDSGEIHRGYRLIKCMDLFSKEFLGNCVAKISDSWAGLSLKLIPAEDIPLRPRARIWLPKMATDNQKLLELLKLQNPDIPMDDWSVICAEEPRNNSMSLVLVISEQGVVALKKAGYKLFFGVHEAKVKVFGPTGSGVDENDDAD